MSDFLGDVVEVATLGLVDGDTVTGGAQADASKKAASTQAEAMGRGIELQRETRDLAREDLSPFKNFGQGNIAPLNQLLTPQGQVDYLSNNPLFDAALSNTERRIDATSAAGGKFNSGGRAQALFQNYLANAQSFLQPQTNNLFNAVNMGQSAAAGQANTALTSGQNISNLYGQQGDALAAGIVGSQNARTGAFNNLLSLGGSLGSAAIMASDIRVKENIEPAGRTEGGHNLYYFNYIGDDTLQHGVMAQEVEKTDPEAVIEIDGIKHVDYSRIH